MLLVTVLRGGAPVRVLGRANLTLEVLPSWTSAAMPSNMSFQGGAPITILGAGFDPASRPGYTCQFSDAAGGTCVGDDPGCVQANSSDSSLPPGMRGPSIAAGFDRVVCWAPAWLHQDRRAVLRLFSGDRTLVPEVLTTALRTFEGLPTVADGRLNGPIRGGTPLSLAGYNMGIVDLSPRVSISHSSCQASVWSSASSVTCFLPTLSDGDAAKAHNILVSLSQFRIGTRNESFSFDGPTLVRLGRLVSVCASRDVETNRTCNNTLLSVSNDARDGGTLITLFGTDFGDFEPSAQARLGSSAAERTMWQSETSAQASLVSGVSSAHAAVLSIHYTLARSSVSDLFSLDAADLSAASQANARAPASGALLVGLLGASLGGFCATQRVQTGPSVGLQTDWRSETSLTVRVSGGTGQSLRVCATVGVSSATRTEQLSIDASMFVQSPVLNNAAATGAVQVTVSGSGWDASDQSPQLDLLGTGSESTWWTSDSSLLSRHILGSHHSRALTLTVGLRPATSTEAFSFAAPMVASSSVQVDEGILSTGWNFSAAGVGLYMPWACAEPVAAGGTCSNRSDWRVSDYPTAIGGPSRWLACSDAPDDSCFWLPQDLQNSPSALVQLSSIYGGFLRQGQYLDEETEGTSLVYKADLSYSAEGAMWGDYLVTVMLVNFGSEWIGVSVRYIDDNNYYRFEMNSLYGVRRLKKRVNGTLTQLYWEPNSAGYKAGTYYLVRVESLATGIGVFMDETSTDSWSQDLARVRSEWTQVVQVNEPLAHSASAGTFALWTAGSDSAFFLYANRRRPYDSAKHANGLATPGLMLTVRGASFGALGFSAGSRLSVTAATASSWTSDTSVAAMMGQGQGATRLVSITAGAAPGTLSASFSFNDPKVDHRFPPDTQLPKLPVQNALWTEDPWLAAAGSGFGWCLTLAEALGSTAAEATVWISVSTVQSRVGRSFGGSARSVITVGQKAGSGTQDWSFDAVLISSSRRLNAASTGSLPLVLFGGNLSPAWLTASVLAGNSRAECTGWASDSAVQCASSQMWATSHRVSISAGVLAGSSTQLLSTDMARVSLSPRPNRATTGSVSVTLCGHGLGLAASSVVAGLGASGCEASDWVSDSAVRSNFAPAMGGTRGAVLTAGVLHGSATVVMSWDEAAASGAGSENQPSTGSATLLLAGAGFGWRFTSSVGRVRGTTCEGSWWHSDTTVLGKAGAGLGGSMRVAVTSGKALQSTTVAISLSSPAVSSAVPRNGAASGSRSVTVVGIALGLTGASGRGALAGSSMEASAWASDTAVLCQLAHGWAGCRPVAVTAGMQLGSVTATVTTDGSAASGLRLGNAGSTGSASITVGGSGLGTADSSGRAWVGSTLCESSAWMADSAVLGLPAMALGGSNRVRLTVGQWLGSVSECFSSNGAAGSSPGRANSAATGSVSVSVAGVGFGLSLASLYALSGASGCEETGWVSDSSVSVKPGYGFGGTRAVTLTAGLLQASLSAALTGDLPALSSQQQRNWAATGSLRVTVSGAQVGAAGASARLSGVGSTCEASVWVSDTALQCSGSGGIARSSQLRITLGRRSGSISEGMSYDGRQASDVLRTNGLATGSILMTLTGANVGLADFSPTGTVAGSACEQSTWLSESSVRCRAGQGVGGSRAVGLTAGLLAGSATAVISGGGGTASWVHGANLAATGSAVVTVGGAGLGLSGVTASVRMGDSVCEASQWLSDSGVQGLGGRGLGRSWMTSVTAGVSWGTASGAGSVDGPRASGGTVWNGASTGSRSVTVAGLNAGALAGSARGGLGGSAAQATDWVSDTSLLCAVGRSLAASSALTLSVGQVPGTASAAGSCDSAAVSSGRAGNQAATGGLSLTLAGGRLGPLDLSVHARAGTTASEQSTWVSDTSALCRAGLALAGTRAVAVTVGVGGGSATEAGSADRADASGLRRSNQAATGSVEMTVVGGGMGLTGVSPTGTVAGSACEQSTWLSDSSLRSIVSTESGSRGSSVASITLGRLAGSVTHGVSLDTALLSMVSNQITARSSVSVVGSNFGNSDSTPGAAFGGTACESSLWAADTIVQSLAVPLLSATRQAVLTVSTRAGSITESFSIDGWSPGSGQTNVGSGSGAPIEVAVLGGTMISTTYATVRVQLGSTACEHTVWLSDSALSCLCPALLLARTLGVAVTAGRPVSMTHAYSADMFLVSATRTANLQDSSGVSITSTNLFGLHTSGLRDASPVAAVGDSATLQTVWTSDSAIECHVSGLTSWRTLRAILTSGIASSGTLTSAISIDAGVALVVTANSCLPSAGSGVVILRGTGFGGGDSSPGFRAGGSAAEASAWSSNSGVSCRAAAGVGLALALALTAGDTAQGTLSYAVSYERPSGSGAVDVELYGAWCALRGSMCACQGVVFFSPVNGTALLVLPTTATTASSSRVACNTSSFPATAAASSAAVAACFCFNRPFGSSTSVTLAGSDFGPADTSPVVTVVEGGDAAAQTAWVSQSSMVCRLPQCSNCSLPSQTAALLVQVPSTAAAVSLSVSLSYSYEVPLNALCPNFWVSQGTFNLSYTTGEVCRFDYVSGERIVWVIDVCSASAGACNRSNISTPANTVTEGSSMWTLPQASLQLTALKLAAAGDELTIASCSDISCSTPWIRSTDSGPIDSAQAELNIVVAGNPYLRVAWTSSADGTGKGWGAQWITAAAGRIFRLFQPVTGSSWYSAAVACTEVTADGGGYVLASIAANTEQAALTNALGKAGVSLVWLGLNQTDSSNLAWLDGSPVGYTSWVSGQPGPANANPRQCVAASTTRGGWITTNCTATLPYICSRK